MRMKLYSVFSLLLAIGPVEAENQFRFLLASNEQQLALVNIATGKISVIDTAEVEGQQSLGTPWGNVAFSPDGKYVIHLRGPEGDKELFIYDSALEQRTQVTLPPMRRGRIRLLHILGWNEVDQVAVLDREPPIVPEKQLYGFALIHVEGKAVAGWRPAMDLVEAFPQEEQREKILCSIHQGNLSYPGGAGAIYTWIQESGSNLSGLFLPRTMQRGIGLTDNYYTGSIISLVRLLYKPHIQRIAEIPETKTGGDRRTVSGVLIHPIKAECYLVCDVESPGGNQSIIYRANDRSEPKEIGAFLPIKSVSISPRGTWIFLTEKETGKSLLLHTQTSEQVYLSSSPIKAIAWSWDEDIFACADSALKLTISDRTGKTISRVDIDWQGFQPNMFHGLLK